MKFIALALLLTTPLSADTHDELITIYGSLRPEEGDAARRMDDGYSRVGVRRGH